MSRDSKSKRDTKNSILVSISGNMAEKYFQKTRPEIYYFFSMRETVLDIIEILLYKNNPFFDEK